MNPLKPLYYPPTYALNPCRLIAPYPNPHQPDPQRPNPKPLWRFAAFPLQCNTGGTKMDSATKKSVEAESILHYDEIYVDDVRTAYMGRP